MNTTIESCKEEIIQCYSNVAHFRCLETDAPPLYAWEISYDAKCLPNDETVPIYFILDTINQNAFSHWVYENSSWLPAFLELRKTYPSIKLVIEKWKDFKKLYFDYYTIPYECICLQSEMQSKNYCFFHAYTSFNDKQIGNVYFNNVFHYKNKIDIFSVGKRIPLLYLPRGTKENLLGCNNRVYNVQNELKEFVKQLGGTVYETDSTNKLEDQIRIVKEASIVLLDYGSNLWVNGLFAENSHIICLNIGWHQHPQYPAMGLLWDMIHKSNTVNQIFAYTSKQEKEDDIPIVCFHLPAITNEILSSLRQLSKLSVNATQ